MAVDDPGGNGVYHPHHGLHSHGTVLTNLPITAARRCQFRAVGGCFSTSSCFAMIELHVASYLPHRVKWVFLSRGQSQGAAGFENKLTLA